MIPKWVPGHFSIGPEGMFGPTDSDHFQPGSSVMDIQVLSAMVSFFIDVKGISLGGWIGSVLAKSKVSERGRKREGNWEREKEERVGVEGGGYWERDVNSKFGIAVQY